MDVGKAQNCQDLQQCPDEEDPEPDLSPLAHNNGNRKGRFIIEEIDDHKYNEDILCQFDEKNKNNPMFNSFRQDRRNFSSKILEGRDLDEFQDQNATALGDAALSFVFDFKNNNYVNCVKFMKGRRFDNLVYKYCFMYCEESPLVNFPDEFPDHDCAMIIQEETVENEDETSQNNKNEHFVDIIHLTREKEDSKENIQNEEMENSISKLEYIKTSIPTSSAPLTMYPTLILPISQSRNSTEFLEQKFNSLDKGINFSNLKEGGKKFISPKCSPIPSPRDLALTNNLNADNYLCKINTKKSSTNAKFLNQNTKLYATSSYKAPRNNNVKMIKDFIKSIENSFNLEDDNENHEEERRKKRIYSADRTYCKKFRHNSEKSTVNVNPCIDANVQTKLEVNNGDMNKPNALEKNLKEEHIESITFTQTHHLDSTSSFPPENELQITPRKLDYSSLKIEHQISLETVSPSAPKMKICQYCQSKSII